MSTRAVCDTNVLVSAFIAGGPPSRVVEAAIDGRVELVLAEPVLVELERILSVKLGFAADSVRTTIAFLGDVAVERVAAPERPPEAITGDRDDDLILACAVTADVAVLVSGDRRHLLGVGEYRGIRVISPQAFLAELA